MQLLRRQCAVLAAGAFAVAAACARNPRGGALLADPLAAQLAHGFDVNVQNSVARVRAETARFQVLDSAVAAGYAGEAHACVANEPQGAMGFHHSNARYVDGAVEVERPEILTYERTPDGREVLTGVEYVIPYRYWPREAAAPPTILGQPMKRADGLQIWYLHAWVWKQNPSGLFADWNPTVHCPEG